MTTARADLVTLASAIDASGDTMATVESFGSGVTLAAVAGDAPLVTAADAVRRFLVHAEGGQLWVSIDNAATAEPRGLISAGGSILIKLGAGKSIRVAAAALS